MRINIHINMQINMSNMQNMQVFLQNNMQYNVPKNRQNMQKQNMPNNMQNMQGSTRKKIRKRCKT